MIRFVDDGGLNPLPPGVRVLIYRAGAFHDTAHLLAQAWTDVVGQVPIDLDVGSSYEVDFVGQEAPPRGLAFTVGGGAPTIAVPGYTSPWKTPEGFRDAVFGMLVKGAQASALDQAPELKGLLVAIGAVLSAVREKLAAARARNRLDFAQGAELDSFVSDYLGNDLPRGTPVDAAYRAEAEAAFLQDPATPDTLNLVAQKWALSYALSTSLPQPRPYVFDRQMNRTRFDAFGRVPGEIIVTVDFPERVAQGAFLDYFYLDDPNALGEVGTYTVTLNPPAALLGLDRLIRKKKAGGKRPVYAYRNVFA